MAEEASVRDVLDSVREIVEEEPELLQQILDEPGPEDQDEPQAGPSQAVVVASFGIATQADPNNDGVTAGSLEAVPVGERAKQDRHGNSPPPQRSQSPEYSSTDSEENRRVAEQHHRQRPSTSDSPAASTSRIPRKPEHKLPRRSPPRPPRPARAKRQLTEEQKRAVDAEREAVKLKRDDQQAHEWHKQNECKICGSVSHWWQQCTEGLYCV